MIWAIHINESLSMLSTYNKKLYLFDLNNNYGLINEMTELEGNVRSFLVWDPEHVILGLDNG